MHNHLKHGFFFEITQFSKNKEIIHIERVHNLMPAEAIAKIINCLFFKDTSAEWFVGPFGNNYTPNFNDQMAKFVALAGEITTYEGDERKIFTPALGQDNVSCSNSGNEVEFVFNAPSKVTGLFVSSDKTKSSVAGTLLSCALLPNAKEMEQGGILRVNAGFSFASA